MPIFNISISRRLWLGSMALCLLMPLSVSAETPNPSTSHIRVVKVEGTPLATLHTVYDVLNQWAEVKATTKGIYVEGKGEPTVYIDNRLLIELSELDQIPASAVQQVELNLQPGAEYAKGTQAVIVIRLLKQKDEGFHLNNNLTLAATQWLATSDELNLSFKRKRMTLDVTGSWNMKHHRLYGEDYTQRYRMTPEEYLKMKYRSIVAGNQVTDTRQLAGGFLFGYDLTEGRHLNVGYDFRTQVRNHAIDEDRLNYEFFEDEKGEMHLERPDTISPYNIFKNLPVRRHTLTADYTAQWADWTLTVGTTAFLEFARTHNDTYKPQLSAQLHYDRDELNMRTYAQMNKKVGEGKVAFGLEHLYSGMKLLYDDLMKEKDRTHADVYENIVSAFGNVSQTWGRFSVSAGLRLEYTLYNYNALGDDEVQEESGMNLRFRRRSFNLYPNLSLTYKQGANEWSLLHSQSYRMPYKGYSRVEVSSLRKPEDALLKTERIFTTGVEYKRNWLQLSATHNYYKDPVCSTTSSNRNFTGQSYHAVNFRINLTPDIGWWTPRLATTVHKQWMRMPTVSQRDNLKEPWVTVTLNNTFHLPNDWQLRLNGEFASKGSDRNIHYRKGSVMWSVGIQKDMLKKRLSFYLSAENLFDLYKLDYTIYRPTNQSEGSNDKLPHPISLSIRYKL